MLLLCNRGLQIASTLHGFVSPTIPLLGRGDGQQQIEGTAIYLTEILLMRPSRLVRAPSCSALSVPAPRNRTCITGHLTWTGRTNTKRMFFLLPVPSCKMNWIYIRSSQWTMIFKKAEKVLSSYFFQLLFATIFYHIYKLLQKLSRKSYILESFGWSTNQAIKKREGEKIY